MSKARTFFALLVVICGVAVFVSCSKSRQAAVDPTEDPVLEDSSTLPSAEAVELTTRHVVAGKPFSGPVDLCLLLSGQMYGYLQPCGCTRPQVGGLERRFELMKRLQGHGYPISAADLGDLGPKDELGPQGRWKLETASNALKSMSYAAVGLGPTELTLPVETALGLLQNYRPPVVVAANLLLTEPELYADVVAPWVIDDPRRAEDTAALVGRLQGYLATPLAGPGGELATAHALPISNRPRVGYFGLISESVIKVCQSKRVELKFTPAEEALRKELPAYLAAGPEVRVLLFQGTSEEARALLKKHPRVFHVVLCRNDASDGVAPLLPMKDDSGAWIIMVGHKGKTVGVVAYRRNQPLEYRLEELVEELELPDNQTNPTREVMRDYVLGVYKSGYLNNVSKIAHPNQLQPGLKDAVFVGSATCAQCHPQTHAKWSSSRHSHAWDALVKDGRPIAQIRQKDQTTRLVGRQYDPDCVRCHVTGFGYRGGFENEEKTPHLFSNGCENCHGPGSLHAAQPGNPLFRESMRLSIRDQRTEQKCRACHDQDNDPHFDMNKWMKIEHGRER